MIEAIIFDMDGLMVDTEPLARQAWERVVAGYGCQLDDATYGRLIGLRLADCSRLVKDAYNIPAEAAQLAEQKQRYLKELRAKGVPPMPGVHRLVEAIELQCLPWAVATSSGREEATAVLKQLGLWEKCKALTTGDEVKRGKPAPDIYLLAAARLDVDPARCLALEDSLPGAQAAASAGMVTVAVPNGLTEAADFTFVDYTFGSLVEVAEKMPLLLGDQIRG